MSTEPTADPENPASGQIVEKPTEPVAGQSRDRPPGPRTLRANPQRLHPTLYQGRVVTVRRWMFGAAALLGLCVGGAILAAQLDEESGNPWDGITQLDLADAPDSIATCDEWRSRAVTQDEVLWGCTDDGYGRGPRAIYRCDDERLLYSMNDSSWGYVGERMRSQVSNIDALAPVDDLLRCGERLFPDPSP